jgi:Uncharacterized protein conserved in bacteria
MFKQSLKFKNIFKKGLKINVGAGGTDIKGFFNTEVEFLDITKPLDWWRHFWTNSIKVVLAEHVLEHLSVDEIKKASSLVYKYLQSGGVFRVAIPDKNRRDSNYIEAVKPPADGHKSFLNVSELTEILENVGFTVNPLEYHDEKGVFHHKKWSTKDGFINRCFKNDKQKKFWNGQYYYTSLIVDAVKPVK